MVNSRGLGAVLSGVVCALLLVTPGSAAAGPAPVAASDAGAAERPAAEARGSSFLSFNIAGGKEHRGRVEPIVSEVVGSLRNRDARGAVLNEVCGSQARALRNRLRGYRVHFFSTGSRRCGGRGVGNVVIADRASVRMRGASRRLPSGDSFTRHVGCVRMSPTAKNALCGTHLSFEKDLYGVRNRQARIVTDISERLIGRGFAVVVGGDLNAVPSSPILRHFYSGAYPKGQGRLRESTGCCRRGGAATIPAGRKIDYLFFSNAWDRSGNDVVPTRRSDHYKVWVRLRRR